ncbi:DUF2786 domain-containing protein [Blastococcus brunescens]|uniref:DUF2786 domain-containing protein n=1 Tax=Blastococcus brunescens TaxID=1564165 RepID=A0ABZ1B0E5_9ACTN|nr:DUF2786 domain-containing protein [Blastococcus sp. BMG 8361]WRL63651.1 DUF2786 domain-containing protein [Blastococcus sp. BMG 8361]
MGKTAAERRATRKRKHQDRNLRRPGTGTHTGPGSGARADEQEFEYLRRQFIHAAMFADDEYTFEQAAAQLALLDPGVDEDGLAASLLVGLVHGLWERGWQPADVAHVVRRSATQRVARLGISVIAEGARAVAAATRAPEDWLAQLAALDALDSPGPAVVTTWRRTEGLPGRDAWRDVLRLFAALTGLGELQQLSAPPSRWGQHRTPPRRTGSAADARILGRIRGLLAKAERTEFPEEAEALSAKAQELMTRHAVDAAVLDAEHGTSLTDQVLARRVHLDNPYPGAKVQLLDAVGRVNAVRVIWIEQLGIATMVGLPADLDAIDLLFTSLLVQATRAMTDTGRAGAGRTRSPAFRRAFLTSYGLRIGERLSAAREHVTEEVSGTRGTDLVPVLRARSEAVDDVFAQMFPRTRASTTRGLDARGWYAGQLAADNADLGSGRDAVRR